MDRVIEKEDGFYCIVSGVEYGSWRSRAEAVGGMKVEQRRRTKRDPKQLREDEASEMRGLRMMAGDLDD